ncbi:MAG: transcription termination factor NusA [Thermodesulfobacteriota bacterium]
MTSELSRIIEQVGKEKGIDKQTLVEALEAAMLTVSIKKFGANMEIEARYNEELGEVELFQFKTVVEQVRNPSLEISLPEAKLVDPEVEFGDSLGMKMDTRSLGRIAAQTAKQVIMQRMREAEREITYGEYVDRTGEMVSGIVLRAEHGNIIIDLGRAEAVLLLKEQIPGETWKRGDRIRAILIDVTKSTKLPQLVVSRVDPRFLTALFDLEVPEIREGIVKIVVAVREPGYRAKVSVASSERNVDPVGACVGVKGSRVQAVVHELRGERIDIIPWSEDIGRFVVSALSPAQITKVIMDDEYKSMEVIVPNDQLSLAIGKKGQNVRLAANLTKWKIDIRGEEAVESPPELAPGQMAEELLALPGVGDKLAQALAEAGYSDVARLAQANPEELAQIPGIGSKKAEQLARAAKEQLGSN